MSGTHKFLDNFDYGSTFIALKYFSTKIWTWSDWSRTIHVVRRLFTWADFYCRLHGFQLQFNDRDFWLRPTRGYPKRLWCNKSEPPPPCPDVITTIFTIVIITCPGEQSSVISSLPTINSHRWSYSWSRSQSAWNNRVSTLAAGSDPDKDYRKKAAAAGGGVEEGKMVEIESACGAVTYLRRPRKLSIKRHSVALKLIPEGQRCDPRL